MAQGNENAVKCYDCCREGTFEDLAQIPDHNECKGECKFHDACPKCGGMNNLGDIS